MVFTKDYSTTKKLTKYTHKAVLIYITSIQPNRDTSKKKQTNEIGPSQHQADKANSNVLSSYEKLNISKQLLFLWVIIILLLQETSVPLPQLERTYHQSAPERLSYQCETGGSDLCGTESIDGQQCPHLPHLDTSRSSHLIRQQSAIPHLATSPLHDVRWYCRRLV